MAYGTILETSDWPLSVKQGYSSPEVRLQRLEFICPASDLYGVSAVFFRMLTGHPLSEQEVIGPSLNRSFPKDLPIFHREAESAARIAVQIVRRGLHTLPRKRYRSVDEMRQDIEELLCRIERKGISHSALWEKSCMDWKHRQIQPAAFQVERKVQIGDLKLTQDQLLEQLQNGIHLLLTGSGGMGKTYLLNSILAQYSKRYCPTQPVALYIPLVDHQAAGNDPYFLRKYLLHGLTLPNQTQHIDTAIQMLDQLFQQSETVKYFLLLDGLNEAGNQRAMLLREIETLSMFRSVSILITDRTSAVREYALYRYQEIVLLPLSQEEVIYVLQQHKLCVPEVQATLELLSNPMMLCLALQIWEMEQTKGNTDIPSKLSDTDGIIRRYMDNLCYLELRRHSGNETEQLRQRYILEHLLPELAWLLYRQNKILPSFEQVYNIVKKSHQNLLRHSFCLAYPNYLGKSRLMLKEIRYQREWFDYAVSEQLIEKLHLLEKRNKYGYRLIHDNFIPCLAQQAEEHHRKLYLVARKHLWQWWLVVGLVVAIASITGFCAIQMWPNQSYSLTQEEQQALDGALQRLSMNLYYLNMQILCQHSVLDRALKPDVLAGESSGQESLHMLMEQQQRELARSAILVDDRIRWIEQLTNAGITLDTWMQLYRRPVEMDQFISKAFSHLEDSLCAEDSPYHSEHQRLPLVDSYQNYLDAYCHVTYLELLTILNELGEEDTQFMLDAMNELTAFRTIILQHPFSRQSAQTLEQQLYAAEGILEQAEEQLYLQNYDIS